MSDKIEITNICKDCENREEDIEQEGFYGFEIKITAVKNGSPKEILENYRKMKYEIKKLINDLTFSSKMNFHVKVISMEGIEIDDGSFYKEENI